ncbi:MAG: hypothetical protein RLZZ597_3781 [Cyanobacteriota bacterium]|jgi:hypothetical protein
MVSALEAIKWSLDDYHRMIDGGILTDRRVELLWGEIVAMAPKGTPYAHGCRISLMASKMSISAS